MSIQTEISRINGAKSSLKAAIEGKGITVPSTTKLDGYGALVEQIQTGGGGQTQSSGFYPPAFLPHVLDCLTNAMYSPNLKNKDYFLMLVNLIPYFTLTGKNTLFDVNYDFNDTEGYWDSMAPFAGDGDAFYRQFNSQFNYLKQIFQDKPSYDKLDYSVDTVAPLLVTFFRMLIGPLDSSMLFLDESTATPNYSKVMWRGPVTAGAQTMGYFEAPFLWVG